MPRRARSALVALALLCCSAGAARAGVLSSATWVESVLGVPIAVPVFATGTSTSSSVSVSLEVPDFSFETFTVVPVISIAYTHVRLAVGGSAMLSAMASMAAASKGVPASAQVDVHTSPAAPVYDMYRLRFAPGAVRYPVATPTQTFLAFYRKAYVHAGSYGWDVGSVTISSLTLSGRAMPDANAMGSFDLTALGAGTVTLVAPRRIQIRTFEPSLSFVRRTAGSFTTLTLHFVPEPAASLLLGATGAALLLRRSARR
jgi:hypothetical protein